LERAMVINRAAIAHKAASVRSWVIPISAVVKATNRAGLTSERVIVFCVLFVAAAVTTAWMIGLAWGAIALAKWLFS
jgi:hypothetical protein